MGIFTAAQCRSKWVREGDIVCEGQGDSSGWLSGKFTLSRVCSSQGGTVKYEQVLMNRTTEPQFRGPGKLHLRETKTPDKKTSLVLCLSVTLLLSAKD